MLAVFGVGVIVGIVIVIGALSLTMRDEPASCLLVLGIIVFLFFGLVVVVPQLVLAG
jgi:hypothetical protein